MSKGHQKKLTGAQSRAVEQLAAEREVWAYNGISIATARVLVAIGVADLETWPPTLSYGSLGSRGGRGRWNQNWVLRSGFGSVTHHDRG